MLRSFSHCTFLGCFILTFLTLGVVSDLEQMEPHSLTRFHSRCIRGSFNSYLMKLSGFLSAIPLAEYSGKKVVELPPLCGENGSPDEKVFPAMFATSTWTSSIQDIFPLDLAVTVVSFYDAKRSSRDLSSNLREVLVRVPKYSIAIAGNMTRAVYKALRLSQLAHKLASDCLSKLLQYVRKDSYMAVHYHIERDFYPMSCLLREKRSRTPQCFSAQEITSSIYNTPELSSYNTILALYDANSTIPRNSPDNVESTYRMRSQDTVGCSAEMPLTKFEKSIVAFLIAKESPIFVGHSSSLFSTGVSIARSLEKLPSYVYSCAAPGEPLQLRHDGGERAGDDALSCRLL